MYVSSNPCMNSGQEAIIGQKQLSDTVKLYDVFQYTQVNFTGGSGMLVNRKYEKKKLADIQEIDILG